MVLVDDGVILGMHDRIKGLQHKMATMHREAQYQVCSFCAAVVAGTRVLDNALCRYGQLCNRQVLATVQHSQPPSTPHSLSLKTKGPDRAVF